MSAPREEYLLRHENDRSGLAGAAWPGVRSRQEPAAPETGE
jgi:hypothetical protein